MTGSGPDPIEICCTNSAFKSPCIGEFEDKLWKYTLDEADRMAKKKSINLATLQANNCIEEIIDHK